MTTRIDFSYNGWDCWRNMFGEWGAILSRKGEQPHIIAGAPSRQELVERIDSVVKAKNYASANSSTLNARSAKVSNQPTQNSA